MQMQVGWDAIMTIPSGMPLLAAADQCGVSCNTSKKHMGMCHRALSCHCEPHRGCPGWASTCASRSCVLVLVDTDRQLRTTDTDVPQLAQVSQARSFFVLDVLRALHDPLPRLVLSCHPSGPPRRLQETIRGGQKRRAAAWTGVVPIRQLDLDKKVTDRDRRGPY